MLSVAERAMTPRDLWLDLVKTSKPVTTRMLKGKAREYGDNLKSRAALCCRWSMVLLAEWVSQLGKITGPKDENSCTIKLGRVIFVGVLNVNSVAETAQTYNFQIGLLHPLDG